MNTIKQMGKQTFGKVWVLIFLALPCMLFAQRNQTTFKHIHASTAKVPNQSSDTLVCQTPTKQLVRQLLNREFWPVYDLDGMDCILGKSFGIKNKGLVAVLNYVGAIAYNDYDQEVSDSLLKFAYLLFRELNDVEGQIFTNVELLDNSISTLEITGDSTIASLFKEIESLAGKTTYIPALLAALDTELLYKHQTKQILSESQLDSLSNHADQFLKADTIRIRNIYTRLFSLYQLAGLNIKANIAGRKALALADPNRSDYPSFFYNLGFNKYMLGEIDSALFYFQNAYQQSAEPKTLYQYNLKYISAQGMAVSHKKLGAVDSAYKYLGKALYAAVDFANFEANNKRLYAEKKFDLQKRRVDILERDLAIVAKEKEKGQLILLVLGVALLFVGAVYLGIKNARLLKKSKELEFQRERLIHILSHDLRSPLHAFLQSANTISQLVALQRFDDVARIGKSLEYTGDTLQETIANLEDWSDYLKSSNASKSSRISSKCNPFELATKAKELYILQAERAEVKVDVRCPKPFTVPCPSFELSLILRNLIANSIKHAVEGSTVIITIDKKSKQNFSLTISNSAEEKSGSLAEKIINQSAALGVFQPQNSSRFGLYLVFETVKKIGGNICANFEAGVLTIEVVLPISLRGLAVKKR